MAATTANSKGFGRFGRVAAAGVTTAALQLMPVSTAGAAPKVAFDQCGGDFQPVWSSNVQDYSVTGLEGAGVTAADNAAFGWSGNTDFDWARDTNGDASIYIGYASFPNAELAGGAYASASIDYRTCELTQHDVFINSTHINAAPAQRDNVDEKQCISAHEMGHSAGLEHSNGVHAAQLTIMLGGNHPDRCHNATPPGAPRYADINDINAKY